MDKGGDANGQASNVGNTSDVIVESQSTQLLDFVLGRAPEPLSSPRDENNAPSRSDHLNSSADDSSRSKDSDDPSPSASAPSYHFHGLATTQSQTQLIDGSSSQKENEGTYETSAKSSVKRREGTGSRNTRSRTANCAQASTKRPLTPSRVLTEPLSPPQPAKVATILSPSQQQSLQKGSTKEAIKTAAMRYRRRPSPPVPSQDSFAGPPPSQDPDLFIATSRQFEIPLDELGRSQSQDQSLVSSRVEVRTSINSSEHPAAQPAMDDYSLSSSSSKAKILVASSDTSDHSQDSQGSRGNYYSISQEPTQLNSDASVAGASDHGVNEEHQELEQREDVADLSTRVEPTQIRTQEETQIIEQSPSAVITSVAEPSVVSDRLSHLSLSPSPPEQHVRHVHPFERRTDVPRFQPAPGPSASEGFSGASPADAPPPPVLDKRSLLRQLPPEKLGRYMYHLQKDSVPVSDASRMATAGTSLGADSNIGNSHLASSKAPVAPKLPVQEEEVIQDLEQQAEMDISLVKPPNRDCDQEIIPPSESDFADNSREEEEVEMGFEESLMKTPLRGKVKQKADPRPASRSPRKPGASTLGSTSGGLAAGVVTKTSMLGSPVKLQESKKTGDLEMRPPSLPRDRCNRPRSRLKGNFSEVASNPPVASTSAAALHREQNPPSPASAAVGDDSELDSPEIPLARMVNHRMEEEEESESGNQDDMATDDEDDRPAGRRGPSSSRKRKRRNLPVSTKKATKARAPARKVTTRSTPASAPPSKKARTSIYVAKKFGAGMGTQVFALFKTDSCFYGAEVHSLNGNRGRVKFFDGLEDTNLGVTQMRRFELRTGDIVIPGSKPHKAKVVDDSLWPSENEVNVVYIEGPDEGLELPVTADALRIPSRTIQSQWKDRIINPSEIIPAVQRKSLKETPSPSKHSVVNTGSSRNARNKLLLKYGIIITQAPGNHNWAREKERYVAIIKDNGGTVLSDWLDVFSLQGKHSNSNKRWTIQRSDVKYAPKDKQHSFDRVFLVSDIHNQKPKYLLALALGIPCVSLDWLDHIAAGEELPWSQFLLAAGHSEPLGAPISQMVDLDWGTTSEHMTEIMENSVPLKVLSGKSVLCLGSELFPNPSKKAMSDADRHLEASRTVPRIILAMGASRVEAVADAKHASEDLTRYDYVIVKDGSQHRRVRGATFVNVTWIKECLIAGRLVSIPDPD